MIESSLAEDRFTGQFTQLVDVPRRAHDPAVHVVAGQLAWADREREELGCSGAGWTLEHARAACVGEGVERMLARPLPGDVAVEVSYGQWPLAEPAVDPDRWVLFHSDQHREDGFPLRPLTNSTTCRWTACRRAATGDPFWVPEEMVYLTPREGESQQYVFGFSTGLSCGRRDDPVLLRGVQEVVERDALIGAWWGEYPLEEWPSDTVAAILGPTIWRRVDRPNLAFRFYRVDCPWSRHVTLVSLAGDDLEGWVFSVGSACRETRRASWEKALLEAVQGRHCVRMLKGRMADGEFRRPDLPTTFFEHALHYSVFPERLSETALERASQVAAPFDDPPFDDPPFDEMSTQPAAGERDPETLATIQTRLGSERPILFRNLTPPGLASAGLDWLVLKVIIPGLQPLHGDHRMPFLGGPMWGDRAVSEWSSMPPHPFA